MTEEPTVAVRLALPWPLHSELKAEAARKGKTLKDLLMELLKTHVEKETESGTNTNG